MLNIFFWEISTFITPCGGGGGTGVEAEEDAEKLIMLTIEAGPTSRYYYVAKT